MWTIYAALPFLTMLLFGGHAIADYGQQSKYMADNKVSESGPDWFVTLGAHCLIHGVVVALMTVAFFACTVGINPRAVFVAGGLAWAEFVAHTVIDISKGGEHITYRQDQALHYSCKLVWILIIALNASEMVSV